MPTDPQTMRRRYPHLYSYPEQELASRRLS